MTADGWDDRAQLMSWAAISALLSAVVRESCPQPERGRFPGRTQQKNLQFWHLSLQALGIAVMKPRGEGQAELVATTLLT